MAKTFCRALSPFSDLSFGSPPESRLPVDVDDFLSSFWWRKLRGGCSALLPYLRVSPNIQNPSASYLAIFPLVTEGGSDAVLDGFDPGLSKLL